MKSINCILETEGGGELFSLNPCDRDVKVYRRQPTSIDYRQGGRDRSCGNGGECSRWGHLYATRECF